jgi:hypothetical protein
MIKLLPNLDEGIQIVGFLKETDECYCAPYTRNNKIDDYEGATHYLIISKETLNIIGITHSVKDSFGIHQELINSNSPAALDFSFDLICPDINDPLIYEEMKSTNGVLSYLDTSIIKVRYLIPDMELTELKASSKQ